MSIGVIYFIHTGKSTSLLTGLFVAGVTNTRVFVLLFNFPSILHTMLNVLL